MKIRHIAIPAAAAALSLTAGLAAGAGGGYVVGQDHGYTTGWDNSQDVADAQLRACSVAIKESEQALSYSADALALAGAAVEAAALWDFDELARIDGELLEITEDLGSPDRYHAARAACMGEDA